MSLCPSFKFCIYRVIKLETTSRQTMPEFRFRRKKQGPSQRSGRNDAEVTATRQIQKNEKLVKVVLEPPQEMAVNGVGGAKDVVSCMRMGKVEEEGEEEGGKFVRQTHRNEERSSFVQEREKFFELLKAKYPEQACSLEMGVAGMEEGVGVTGDGDLAMSEKCEQVSELWLITTISAPGVIEGTTNLQVVLFNHHYPIKLLTSDLNCVYCHIREFFSVISPSTKLDEYLNKTL